MAKPEQETALIERRFPQRFFPHSWYLRYQRWMDRRIPPSRQMVLHQKNLFIFLSSQGGSYLLLTALLWIGATNYQNNLVMALCFLLLSILFVVIHQTFANLSGLHVRFVSAEPVFAGDTAQFMVELESSSSHQQLLLGWPQSDEVMISLQGGVPAYCRLSHVAPKRGVFRPGRFRLQTFFPMGVIRCWTWLDLCTEVLVYPEPLEADFRQYAGGDSDDQGMMVSGSDDFYALRNYVAGDSLSRVAWKQYAAGRGLFVREYVDYRGSDIWLDFQAMPDPDPEVRLSKLCFCTLQLAASGRSFGLRLLQERIEPASGDEHVKQVLRALAECPL